MFRSLSYDKENNVLFADYSNLTVSTGYFNQLMAELPVITAELPEKVYLLVCLHNTKIALDLHDQWGKYTQEALQYVRGVVRYEANDLRTSVTIRSNTVKYGIQGNNSYIYPNRASALAAIKELEKE